MTDAPVSKYEATITIWANSHEELARQVNEMDLNWPFRVRDRDEVDLVSSGGFAVRLRHTNPEQTPERYEAELKSWMDERRSAKRAAALAAFKRDRS